MSAHGNRPRARRWCRVDWSAVRRAGQAAPIALLVASLSALTGCRQLYSGPPVVVTREVEPMQTKRVRAKREPDRLIAEDLSVCFVIPEVFAGVKAGDSWRCAWRYLPSGM